MPRSERFICISYSLVDFLIPHDDIVSAVSIGEFDTEAMCGPMTGIFDFDSIAAEFGEERLKKNVCTMIILKKDDEEVTQRSIITASECKVRIIKLTDFSLFSDFYAQSLAHLGFQACVFDGGRIQFLVDINRMLDYLSAEGEEVEYL